MSGGTQGIAAQRKQRVGQSDRLNLQHLRPHLCDLALLIRSRRNVFVRQRRPLAARFRELVEIDLEILRERQPLEEPER